MTTQPKGADRAGNGSHRLRLGFAGTPEFAVHILQGLIRGGRTPEVVYTQPDRPVGRGRKLQPTPVKSLARDHDLPVRDPASLRGPEQAEALKELGLDVLVVAAYGLLLPPAILRAPRYGCVNVHPSLLPRWRGAAPVERAILAGDEITGVCIMQMDEGLDTGPVYTCRTCPIDDETDTPGLEGRLAALGNELLLQCLADLPHAVPTPQPGNGVTYASKIERADAAVRWSSPAIHIERQVRALRHRIPPFAGVGRARMALLDARAEEDTAPAPPGTILAAGRNGIRIACGEGVLNVRRLQLNLGKGRPLSPSDAVNGYPSLFAVGSSVVDADAVADGAPPP